MQIGTSGPWGKVIKRSTLGIGEVKGHGHTRLKLDVKTWRRHHSRPPWIQQLYSPSFTLLRHDNQACLRLPGSNSSGWKQPGISVDCPAYLTSGKRSHNVCKSGCCTPFCKTPQTLENVHQVGSLNTKIKFFDTTWNLYLNQLRRFARQRRASSVPQSSVFSLAVYGNMLTAL